MLTGRLPFEGSIAVVIGQILTKDPISLQIDLETILSAHECDLH